MLIIRLHWTSVAFDRHFHFRIVEDWYTEPARTWEGFARFPGEADSDLSEAAATIAAKVDERFSANVAHQCLHALGALVMDVTRGNLPANGSHDLFITAAPTALLDPTVLN